MPNSVEQIPQSPKKLVKKIFCAGYINGAIKVNDIPNKEEITHLIIENFLPSSDANNNWTQIYHYQEYIVYHLNQVAGKFLKALLKLSKLTRLTLIIRHPLLSKNGFDKFAENINENMLNLKQIQVYCLSEVQNERDNWTQQLREDIKVIVY